MPFHSWVHRERQIICNFHGRSANRSVVSMPPLTSDSVSIALPDRRRISLLLRDRLLVAALPPAVFRTRRKLSQPPALTGVWLTTPALVVRWRRQWAVDAKRLPLKMQNSKLACLTRPKKMAVSVLSVNKPPFLTTGIFLRSLACYN